MTEDTEKSFTTCGRTAETIPFENQSTKADPNLPPSPLITKQIVAKWTNENYFLLSRENVRTV